MLFSLSLRPGLTVALSRRRMRAGYRRLAFKAFPRLTGFIAL